MDCVISTCKPIKPFPPQAAVVMVFISNREQSKTVPNQRRPPPVPQSPQTKHSTVNGHKGSLNSLSFQVVYTRLDVGVVIINLIFIECCLLIKCVQGLLKFRQLSFSKLAVDSLISNILEQVKAIMTG